jgi:hypothetical protein
MPSCSVPRPSSSSAQIIPAETTPRSLAALSLVPSGMTAPGLGHGDGLARRDVRRAADDLRRLAGGHVDGADAQPVGVGVLDGLEDLADDERVEVRHPVVVDPLDLRPGHRQALGELRRVEVGAHVLVQPVQGDAHQPNCSRSRRSLS